MNPHSIVIESITRLAAYLIDSSHGGRLEFLTTDHERYRDTSLILHFHAICEDSSSGTTTIRNTIS
jgi:hypothetical protein